MEITHELGDHSIVKSRLQMLELKAKVSLKKEKHTLIFMGVFAVFAVAMIFVANDIWNILFFPAWVLVIIVVDSYSKKAAVAAHKFMSYLDGVTDILVDTKLQEYRNSLDKKVEENKIKAEKKPVKK